MDTFYFVFFVYVFSTVGTTISEIESLSDSLKINNSNNKVNKW